MNTPEVNKMSLNLRSRLQDMVKSLLKERFSGGCKMTELITEVLSELRNGSRGELDIKEFDLEEFDDLLHSMHEVKVLEYDWDMGGMIRTKNFVYTKF